MTNKNIHELTKLAKRDQYVCISELQEPGFVATI